MYSRFNFVKLTINRVVSLCQKKKRQKKTPKKRQKNHPKKTLPKQPAKTSPKNQVLDTRSSNTRGQRA